MIARLPPPAGRASSGYRRERAGARPRRSPSRVSPAPSRSGEPPFARTFASPCPGQELFGSSAVVYSRLVPRIARRRMQLLPEPGRREELERPPELELEAEPRVRDPVRALRRSRSDSRARRGAPRAGGITERSMRAAARERGVRPLRATPGLEPGPGARSSALKRARAPRSCSRARATVRRGRDGGPTSPRSAVGRRFAPLSSIRAPGRATLISRASSSGA